MGSGEVPRPHPFRTGSNRPLRFACLPLCNTLKLRTVSWRPTDDLHTRAGDHRGVGCAGGHTDAGALTLTLTPDPIVATIPGQARASCSPSQPMWQSTRWFMAKILACGAGHVHVLSNCAH